MKYTRNAKRPLRPDQLFALNFLQELGYGILAMAPGTGKTITAIRAIACYHPPILIIGRRDDFLTWRLELQNEEVPEQSLHLIEKGSDPLPAITRSPVSPIDWVMTTYDLVKNPRVNRWIKQQEFQVVIFDELHLVRRWQSKRTKTIYQTTRDIPHAIGLTGSLLNNDAVEDMFSQALIVARQHSPFGLNYWTFRKTYFIQSGPGWYPMRSAEERCRTKLRTMAFHVHEDDVLKLPPAHHTIKSAHMSGEQRRHTEELLNIWETEVVGAKDGRIEVNLVISQLQKLKQIASGFIYDEQHTPHYIRCPKFELLKEYIKERGTRKTVIWCAFTAEIEMIAAYLKEVGIPYLIFRGSRKVKEAARLHFRDDPTYPFFLANEDSGVGMNELVVADTAFYYSHSLKVVSRQQSMRRTRRQGSEVHKHITYRDFITEGSVEQTQLTSVGNAMTIAQNILNDLRHGYGLRKLRPQ